MAYRMSEAAMEVRKMAGRNNSIPVMVDGVEYNNMVEAEEVTGIENIARKLRGASMGEVVEIKGFKIVKLRESRTRERIKIYKYDYECVEILGEYDSVVAAADDNNISAPNMSLQTKKGLFRHKKSNACYSRKKL